MSFDQARRTHLLLLFIFILSGCAGLIYQSIWTQYLGLFLGHAAYAQSLVLIIFMGGLGVGAFIASRRSESIARPLMVYAIVELLLGLFGLAFDPIYRATTGFAYSQLFSGAAPLTVGILRWGLASLLILPQCILLGLTFPLMSSGCIRLLPNDGGRVLGGLYFANSLGAAGGALLATFMLLPAVGLPGTLLSAGLLNILVAIVVWPLTKESTVPVPVAAGTSSSGSLPTLILAAAAITGLTSFVYEIVWVRMLSLVVGSTLHAFELMLAAFISGIAFGGLWLRSRADRMVDPMRSVGWIQFGMGIAALGSLWLYSHAFDWVSSLMALLARSDTGYAIYNLASAVISMLIMFPAAFFAGMTLPLLTLILMRRNGEREIGRVYAANTFGSIVGVLLGIHILMPMLGVKHALWIAAAGDLALGAVLLGRAKARTAAIAVVSVSVVALLVTTIVVQFDPLRLASSVYRSGRTSLSDGTTMLYYKDGKTATIAMYQSKVNNGPRSIATNGKVDAGVILELEKKPTPDEYTMALAAVFPMAMNPNAKTAGVIGFGSGITTHTLLGNTRLERVDTVEIEPFMVEGARLFEHRSARAYSDPRSNIVFDDAKAHFASHRDRYNIIVSEPSNPWMAGVANLFSDEFYAFVPKHLSDNGLFVQWLQLYEITPDLVASVIRAMLPHFSDVRAYMTNSADLILIATPNGRVPRLGDEILSEPLIAKDLERYGIHSAVDMEMHSLVDATGLRAFADMWPVAANSDYFPILMLNAPRARFLGRRGVDLSSLQAVPVPLLEVVAGFRVPPSDVPLTKAGRDVPRHEPTLRARDLREELQGRPTPFPTELPLDHLALANVVRDYAARCSDSAKVQIWMTAAVHIASRTIPFLDANGLQGVWIDPVWTAGCTNPDPLASSALTFFAALSKRDWPAVLSSGALLLADPGMNHRAFESRYVVSAMQVAAFATGDYDAVPELRRRYKEQVVGEQQVPFYVHWLESVARLTKAQRSAPVR